MNFKRFHESKNLFDENAIQNGYYGSSGSISTFTSDDRYRAFQMSIKAGTYTIKIQADEGIRLLRIATANEFYNVQEDNRAYTFVISSDAIVYVSWRNLQTTNSFTNMTVMLNTGSTPQPYEPYSSEVWHDVPYYIHNTSTDTITTLPADVYADGNNATVGLVGNMSQTGTPVCVWYILAESETAVVNEPLRKIGDYADEVSGITIPTIAGANTLSVDTTLQPSEVTATYKGWHPVQSVHERESGAWD